MKEGDGGDYQRHAKMSPRHFHLYFVKPIYCFLSSCLLSVFKCFSVEGQSILQAEQPEGANEVPFGSSRLYGMRELLSNTVVGMDNDWQSATVSRHRYPATAPSSGSVLHRERYVRLTATDIIHPDRQSSVVFSRD